MAVITASQLRQEKQFSRMDQSATVRLSEKSKAFASVFLSHSHHDEALVEYVIGLFKGLGAAVYVDWLDNGLPTMTNATTAKILRDKIGANEKFVVLGTPNGLNSRWVPWELGVADTRKGAANIAVLPIDNREGAWEGSEYMGLYASIEKGTSGYVVRAGSGSVTLFSWIRT